MGFSSRFEDIADELGIQRGDILFVHSGMDWIGGGVTEALQVIKCLVALVGPEGTLCMPSYTWRGALPGRPPEGSVVDLRRSPAAVGLLPEVFRRWPGVLRSISYWVPVCAWGRQAVELLAEQQHVINPFGPGSTFRRISEANGKLIGLGVSLNTSSLAHLPDFDLGDICPLNVMTDQPIDGTVIDMEGISHTTRTQIVCGDLIGNFRPSALFEHDEALRRSLVCRNVDGGLFFSYPVRQYHRTGVEVGRAFLSAGYLPPWLGGQPLAEPQR